MVFQFLEHRPCKIKVIKGTKPIHFLAENIGKPKKYSEFATILLGTTDFFF